MVLNYGKYCGKTVDEVKVLDPYYIKWIASYEKPTKTKRVHPLDEVSEYLKQNKNIIEEIDQHLATLAEKNVELITEINKHIFMCELLGTKRGVNFLKSIKNSLSDGRSVNNTAFDIATDIMARGTGLKPIRRNSKKYIERKEALAAFRKSTTHGGF